MTLKPATWFKMCARSGGFLLRSIASFHARITHANEDKCGMNDFVRLHEGDEQEVGQVKKRLVNLQGAMLHRAAGGREAQTSRENGEEGHCGFLQ